MRRGRRGDALRARLGGCRRLLRRLPAPARPPAGDSRPAREACAPSHGRAAPLSCRSASRPSSAESNVNLVLRREDRGRSRLGDEAGFGHLRLERGIDLGQTIQRHAVDMTLERRSLEDAQAAATIALDAHGVLALQRLQQIHQAAETVAALIVSAVGLTKDLFDVAQIHRPPGVRGGSENLRCSRDAVGRALGRDDRLRSR